MGPNFYIASEGEDIRHDLLSICYRCTRSTFIHRQYVAHPILLPSCIPVLQPTSRHPVLAVCIEPTYAEPCAGHPMIP